MRIATILSLLGTVVLAAQEMPKPTPHHESMKAMEGTWDATVKMYMAPGQPPMEAKGTEVNTRILGGFWLQTEFAADMGGMPFAGRGLFGYDTFAKRHVGTWVDSMSTWQSVTKATCANGCRDQIAIFEGYGEDGKPKTFKEVTTQADDDHRTMTMFHKAKGGKFVKTMEIAYTRRK